MRSGHPVFVRKSAAIGQVLEKALVLGSEAVVEDLPFVAQSVRPGVDEWFVFHVLIRLTHDGIECEQRAVDKPSNGT